MPPVSEEFTADSSDYLAKLQGMIDQTERLISSIGDAITKVGELAAAVNALPDSKTIEVNVVYKTLGNVPQDITAATQVVKQVIIPGQQPSGGTVNENIGTGDLDAAKQAAAQLAAENTTLGETINAVRAKMADENLTAKEAASILAKLAYAEQVAGSAARDAGDGFDQSTAATLRSIDATLQQAKVLNDSQNVLIGTDQVLRDAGVTLDDTGQKTSLFNKIFGTGIPLWVAGAGQFGALTGKVQLFGGALTNMGVPAIFATASGLHILLDSVVEIGATLIPAAIAFGAFGIAAAGDVQNIYKQMTQLHTVTVAYGQSIYPFTGALQAMQDAVKPEVYTIFGEALGVITRNTGQFTQLAVGAGKVLEDLGARIAAAVDNGHGFTTFLHNAVSDLAGWGNLIGNITGIFGNLLKALPGYAQYFLGFAEGFTHVVEVITGSGFFQGIIKAGLALHGFLLWVGLAVTGIVALAGPLQSLGTWFLGAAIKIEAMGAAFIATAAEEGIFAAAMGALAAVNPFVWVAAGVAALGGLVYWLTQSTSATQAYDNAVQQTLQSAPVTSYGVDLVAEMAKTTGNLSDAQKTLSNTTQYVTVQQGKYGGTIQVVSSAYQQQQGIVQGYKGELSTLSNYQNNYNILLKAAGGNLGLLNQAGITSQQIMNAGTNTTGNYTNQMQQAIIEVQGAAAAQNALSLGTGRAAAAMNAQSNTFMSETLPALQQVTQAEDNVMNVILGGEQSFLGFQQTIQGTTAKFVSPSGLAQAFKLAGGNLSGLGEQSIAFANTLYSDSIPALQKTIDSLQQQGIGQTNLTKVVATGAGEIAQYTQGNTEANSVIVSLINNALGPGTVSLKTLNEWIKNNSTSLNNMNGIVAQSTIAVSGLAGVMSGALDAAMTQAIIQANGSMTAFKNAAAAVNTMQGNVSNLIPTATSMAEVMLNDLGGNTDKTKAKFYSFYEQLGLTNGQITTLWQNIKGNLIGALTSIPKTTSIWVNETGKGNFTISGVPGITAPQTGPLSGGYKLAGGGVIPGYEPGHDSVLAMLSKGEGVLTPQAVRSLGGEGAIHAINQHAQHFASGGIIPDYSGNVGGLGPWTVHNYEASVNLFASAMAGAINSSVQKMQASSVVGAGGGYANPIGVTGNANINSWIAQAIAATGVPASWAPDLLTIAMYESGFNPNAINLTDSNAAAGDPSRGLMQTIMTTFDAYHQAGTSWNIYDPVANIAAAIRYIEARYGNVFNVPGIVSLDHGGKYVGYDSGGWLMPGLTMAVNNTGRPEMVTPGGGFVADGVHHIHVHLDGQEIWDNQQQYTFRYNLRNQGRVSGIVSP